MEIGKEFVQAIVELAERSKVTVPIPGAPSRWYLQRQAAGDYLPKEYEPGRPVVKQTVDDVVGFAAMLAPAESVVFVDRNQAATLTDIDRNVWLTLAMPFTAEFGLLNEPAKLTGLAHKEFLALLRTELPTPGALVARLQELKTSLVAEKASLNAAGKEFVSKSVQRQILGDGWKDQADFELDVYEGLRDEMEPAIVRCLIDANLEEETFGIVPLFGELEKAVRHAQAAVIELLKNAIGRPDVKIVRGRAVVV